MTTIRDSLRAALRRHQLGPMVYTRDSDPRRSNVYQLRVGGIEFVAMGEGISSKHAKAICARMFSIYLVNHRHISADEVPELGETVGAFATPRLNFPLPEGIINPPAAASRKRHMEGSELTELETECRELRDLLAKHKRTEARRNGEQEALQKELDVASSLLSAAHEQEETLKAELRASSDRESALKGELESARSTPSTSSIDDACSTAVLRAELERKNQEFRLLVEMAESLRTQLNEATNVGRDGTDLEKWKCLTEMRIKNAYRIQYEVEVSRLLGGCRYFQIMEHPAHTDDFKISKLKRELAEERRRPEELIAAADPIEPDSGIADDSSEYSVEL